MRVALRGGSFYRTAISSAPFLLPLFFQIGLGYDAFHAGLLVLALFVGILWRGYRIATRVENTYLKLCAVGFMLLPVVQACGLVFAGAFVLLNTIADVLGILVNPRLRKPR